MCFPISKAPCEHVVTVFVMNPILRRSEAKTACVYYALVVTLVTTPKPLFPNSREKGILFSSEQGSIVTGKA